MKKSRVTETQIVSILKEADAGRPVKDVCRKHGISTPTYYRWKSKYGGMEARDLKRVKELEAENARLKRLYSDMAPENAAMKDLIAKKNSEAVREARRRLPKRVRTELYVPRLPDTVWSADFMADTLFNGRRFRTFNAVDDFNREALHIEIDTSITSERLVRIFQQLQAEQGLPQVLRTDNGPEFLGEAFTSWAKDAGMAIDYIRPGKPNENAYIERFNRTYREEVLDQHLFARLDDVREATHWWMIEYNEERPHDSLGDQTPLEARQQIAGISTFEVSP